MSTPISHFSATRTSSNGESITSALCYTRPRTVQYPATSTYNADLVTCRKCLHLLERDG